MGAGVADSDTTHERREVMKVHKSQRVFQEEKKYPGVGALICVGSGLLFWGSLAYLFVH